MPKDKPNKKPIGHFDSEYLNKLLEKALSNPGKVFHISYSNKTKKANK